MRPGHFFCQNTNSIIYYLILGLIPTKTIKLPKKIQPKTMKNHETTLKNHGNQPKTMKNHETTLKNHGNQPKTIKNHETTLKNHEKP